LTFDFAGLAGLTLLGAAAGLAVARASMSLPGGSARPTRARYATCAAACAMAAFWAGLTAVGLLAPISAVLAILLILIAVIDAEHFWLPHKLTVPLGVLGLAEAAALEPDQLPARLIGAVVGFVVLAVIAWAYRRLRGREGLGGGDFRLLAAAGAWVGWGGLPSVLVLACLCGLAVALVQAFRRRRLDLGLEVPFGVYLAAGLWLTWLYGPVGLG
jgi:leader peptidase (prepilin peptidase)/N-methyltransferase